MPTVPNLETPQVAQEALPGRAFPRIDDSVNPAAYGAPVAKGLEDISNAISQEDYKEKVQNDNLRVIDANTQLEAGRNALLYGTADKNGVRQGGAFALHGMDAMDLPNKLLPSYQKMAEGISQTLTPDQQRIFHTHIAAGGNELNLQLNRYENEESNRLANQVYTNAASQAVESASVGWRDPIVVGKSRADIKALVQLQGDREGWPQAERDAQTQKQLAELHFSVVDRMLADGNPRAALNYFVGSKAEPGIRDSNELTGHQAQQLGAAIDAAVRQQGVQVQSQVAEKVRDVRSAAINGQLIPPSSMPADAELRMAYPDTWQTVKAGIQRDVQMGSDLKSFAALSPQQIGQHVDSYRPTQVTGAAEEYDRFNAAAQAAQRTLAERAKDPRQYAIDNNLGSQPLDFRDPQSLGAELRSRLTSTNTLSRQMGGYVPPLTRQESTQLAQTLEGQTPTDRLRSLGSLSTALNDDRGFQEVMRQVMPGSPVTAIVGSQVSQTNPTNAPVWFDQHFAQPPANQARILAGEQLLNPQGSEKEGEKGKKAFPMPPDGGMSGLREQFAQKTGDLFRTRPQLGDAHFQAFKAAYASLLADQGDLSANGSSKVRDQALQMAVGTVTQFHHGTVSVPQGMDPSRFEGLMDNAVKARLIQTTQGNAPRQDLADLQANAGSAYTDASKWQKRADGSQKGNGWLGLLRRPDGGVSSEISIGVELGGKEQDIPLIVPGLTRPEVDKLLSLKTDENFNQNLPQSIKQKAIAFASQRIAAGQSPFASPQESPGGRPASSPDDLLSKISGYQVREIGGLGSGKYELTNGNVPLVRADGNGPFVVDLRNDYLPGVAHGSPEDQARTAPEPLTPQGIAGQSTVPKPGAEPRALKAPSIAMGGKGRGAREHPSQAEAPDL